MNKADPKAINDEVSRILRKECDSSFKATEREARVMAFASKTNAPAVGKYTPRYSQIDPSRKENYSRYFPEKENEGFLRKRDMAMKTMHICPHTIRVIEDWAGKKVSPRGHSMMDKPNKEKDVPFQQRTTITPGVGDQGENLDGDVTPIRAVTNHTRNRSDIARGTLPNKNTFFVRTL